MTSNSGVRRSIITKILTSHYNVLDQYKTDDLKMFERLISLVPPNQKKTPEDLVQNIVRFAALYVLRDIPNDSSLTQNDLDRLILNLPYEEMDKVIQVAEAFPKFSFADQSSIADHYPDLSIRSKEYLAAILKSMRYTISANNLLQLFNTIVSDPTSWISKAAYEINDEITRSEATGVHLPRDISSEIQKFLV